jgi:hypothetical protein
MIQLMESGQGVQHCHGDFVFVQVVSADRTPFAENQPCARWVEWLAF